MPGMEIFVRIFISAFILFAAVLDPSAALFWGGVALLLLALHRLSWPFGRP